MQTSNHGPTEESQKKAQQTTILHHLQQIVEENFVSTAFVKMESEIPGVQWSLLKMAVHVLNAQPLSTLWPALVHGHTTGSILYDCSGCAQLLSSRRLCAVRGASRAKINILSPISHHVCKVHARGGCKHRVSSFYDNQTSTHKPSYETLLSVNFGQTCIYHLLILQLMQYDISNSAH